MKVRRLVIRLAAVAVCIAIAAVMMVIGRGHTVYLDNEALDYNGQTCAAPYKVTVYVDGEQVAKLYDKPRERRGMTTCIGQNFHMDLVVTEEKDGSEVSYSVNLKLPYNMDGVIVNLPAVLRGLPSETWYTEFIPAPEPETEEPVESGGELGVEGDEFGMDGMEDLGM